MSDVQGGGLRENLVTCLKIFERGGLLGMYGHVSVRLPDTDGGGGGSSSSTPVRGPTSPRFGPRTCCVWTTGGKSWKEKGGSPWRSSCTPPFIAGMKTPSPSPTSIPPGPRCSPSHGRPSGRWSSTAPCLGTGFPSTTTRSSSSPRRKARTWPNSGAITVCSSLGATARSWWGDRWRRSFSHRSRWKRTPRCSIARPPAVSRGLPG